MHYYLWFMSFVGAKIWKNCNFISVICQKVSKKMEKSFVHWHFQTPKIPKRAGISKFFLLFFTLFFYITRLANLSLVLPKDDIEKYDASNLLNCHWIKKYCILNTISSHFLYLLLYFLSWTNIILYVICKHSILFYYFFPH